MRNFRARHHLLHSFKPLCIEELYEIHPIPINSFRNRFLIVSLWTEPWIWIGYYHIRDRFLTLLPTFLFYVSVLDGTLYAATALLGICYGAQYSTMISTVSELFGLRHFGVITSFMMLLVPLISAVFLAGNSVWWYRSKETRLDLLWCKLLQAHFSGFGWCLWTWYHLEYNFVP